MNNEKVEYWLDLAEYDLKTAEVMLKGRRYLYVGFMCHQVIEKTLKACSWYFLGKEPEFTHSLSRLLRSSGIDKKIFSEHIELLDILEPMNIEAHYPIQKEKLLHSLTRKRCKELLKKTKEFYLWIKTMLL
ncbi:MAG: DNA-binding protein [Spirochaetes bacterium]|nr:MAG: DNA-binding protein [Spirochaetota bacterium]